MKDIAGEKKQAIADLDEGKIARIRGWNIIKISTIIDEVWAQRYDSSVELRGPVSTILYIIYLITKEK